MLWRTVRGTAQEPGRHRGRLAALPPQAGKTSLQGARKGPHHCQHLLPLAKESEEAQGQQAVWRGDAHRASQGGPSHPHGVPRTPAQDADSWAQLGPVSPDPPSGSHCLTVGSESPSPSNLMRGDSLQVQCLFLQGMCEMKQEWTQKLHRGQR